MPYLWRKKMSEQGYNYLDRSIQEMSSYFETVVENIPAVRSLPRKKKKQNSKKWKAVSFKDSDKDFSENKKKQARRNSVNIIESAVILRTNAQQSRSLLKRSNPTSPKDIGKK